MNWQMYIFSNISKNYVPMNISDLTVLTNHRTGTIVVQIIDFIGCRGNFSAYPDQKLL